MQAIHRKASRRLINRILCCVLMQAMVVSIVARADEIYQIDDGKFDSHVEYHPVTLLPGKELVLGDVAGSGKVTYFYYTDSGAPEGITYPGLVLKVYWDDASQPSILVPLWSFFGVFGRKTVDYHSMPMQVNHYCYMSYLPMPFSKHARFVLLNDGDETYARSVAWGIDYEINPSYQHEPSRLHVSWQRSNPTRDAVHTILDVSGTGHYIGNFLQVNSTYAGWWGEGDTIFDIDGVKVTHSPGTEDEYGSAWEFGHTYSSLYSGYIQMDGGMNRMYRWYCVNPIRFQKSLRVQIQDQRWEHGQTPSKDDFTSVAFWYQKGAHPAPPLLPYAERIAPSAGMSYRQSP